MLIGGCSAFLDVGICIRFKLCTNPTVPPEVSPNWHDNAGLWPQFPRYNGRMIRSAASRARYVVCSIPTIQPGNLLPVMVMILAWLALLQSGLNEATAFVISCVAAQACLVWRNLPRVAQSFDEAAVRRQRLLILPVGLAILLAGLQLMLMSPIFTQRLLSIFGLIFLSVMLLGLRREKELLDRITPTETIMGRASLPVSLLRVNAIIAALVVVVNELLIAYETLAVWMTLMPVILLILHSLYWVMVLLVLPRDEADSSA